jgi:asparagine synthetase B (glutamine-hydrolysing)
MTAFAVILSTDLLTPNEEGLFARLVSKLNSQIGGLSCECVKTPYLHAAKLWLPHARTQEFAKDEATASWLACVGNPSYGQNVGMLPGLSQVLLNDYLVEGPKVITSLNAPFAIIIFDGRDKSLNVVTDRGGIQHIYIAKLQYSYVLSTSSLALASVIPVHLNRLSIVDYFLVGHLLEQKTFFKEIDKIDQATWVSFIGGKVNKHRYWLPPAEIKGNAKIGDIAKELANELKKAVSGRIGPTNDTSIEITGGFDTRVNLACAATSGKAFLACTIGEPDSAEVRVAQQLQRIQHFPHYVLSPAKDIQDRFLDDLYLIHALTDGESNCLNLIASPSYNRQMAKLRQASISGVGGEILRGFYYISHKGVPNRAKNIRIRRLIALKMLPNIGCKPEIFSDAFPPDYRDVLERSVGNCFLNTKEKSIFWRLDNFYLKARQQRFVGRSSTFNNFFYRQELPFLDNNVLDMSFTIPWRFKKNSAIVRHALVHCHPAYAGVALVSGLPARPLKLNDCWTVLRHYGRFAKKVSRKIQTSFLHKSPSASDDVGVQSLVARQLASEQITELLSLNNMASAFLYDADKYNQFIKRNRGDGFKDSVQIGLILSFELTCRYVGTSLRR